MGKTKQYSEKKKEGRGQVLIMGEGSQTVQTSSYKIPSSGNIIYSIVNNTVSYCYQVDLKSLITARKTETMEVMGVN